MTVDRMRVDGMKVCWMMNEGYEKMSRVSDGTAVHTHLPHNDHK